MYNYRKIQFGLYNFEHFMRVSKNIFMVVNAKLYGKTWRFREAFKKPMHNNVNTVFIVICFIL